MLWVYRQKLLEIPALHLWWTALLQLCVLYICLSAVHTHNLHSVESFVLHSMGRLHCTFYMIGKLLLFPPHQLGMILCLAGYQATVHHFAVWWSVLRLSTTGGWAWCICCCWSFLPVLGWFYKLNHSAHGQISFSHRTSLMDPVSSVRTVSSFWSVLPLAGIVSGHTTWNVYFASLCVVFDEIIYSSQCYQVFIRFYLFNVKIKFSGSWISDLRSFVDVNFIFIRVSVSF